MLLKLRAERFVHRFKLSLQHIIKSSKKNALCFLAKNIPFFIFFNHAVVKFSSGFIRNSFHYQVLDLLFQGSNFFIILFYLQVRNRFLLG